MGYAKKVDANQKILVEYIRSLGASVCHLHTAHKGVPDIVIGFQGVNYFCEIKGLKGSLNERQVKWFSDWKGQAIVIRTKEDVDNLLNLN